MTPTIRTAEPRDLPAIVALLDAGTLRDDEDPSSPDAYFDALEEIAATPGSEVLVAELDHAVVGVCQLITFRHLQHQGGRCAEIESVHVAEAHRGAGIGGALVDAAVLRARAAGCYRVQLTSHKTRTDAHRFYDRHGFVATHEGYKRYL
jgi:GNAT superfamily N-acetyltransferase